MRLFQQKQTRFNHLTCQNPFSYFLMKEQAPRLLPVEIKVKDFVAT
jgi:hypothetical protein